MTTTLRLRTAARDCAGRFLSHQTKGHKKTFITAAQVRAAAKSRVNESKFKSVLVSLDRQGAPFGMDLPHRLAQKRYDTRADFGNAPEKDGDGYLYRGLTATQLTGKNNYRQFRDWCRKNDFDCADFVAKPDLVNKDPWEGLAPPWYRDTSN